VKTGAKTEGAAEIQPRMGDNRDNSFDSRYFGTVERNRIVGKATAVVMSLDRNHDWLPREHRFFRPLDGKASR
jgi:signal peptidase I